MQLMTCYTKLKHGGGGVLLINAYCDASFCPVTKAYGWAYMINIKGEKPASFIPLSITESGSGIIDRPDLAERSALMLLEKRIRKNLLRGVEAIVIYSDCKGMLGKYNSILNYPHVTHKHIKSHKGDTSVHGLAHGLVDKEARRKMRKKRNLLLASKEFTDDQHNPILSTNGGEKC